MKKPPWSKGVLLEYIQTPEIKHDKKKKYGSFATKWGEVVKCSLCEGNHDLDDCNSFLQFDLQERSTLRSLIDKGCGIVEGLEKISKTNSQGFGIVGGWKNLENLIAGGGLEFRLFFLFLF